MPKFKAAAILLALLPAALHGQGVEQVHPDSARKTFVIGEFSYVNFHGDIDPWKLTALSLGHTTRRGTLLARVNHATRFAISGYQIEADAYPRFGPKTYAYLNAGYSGAVIFPRWRLGAEMFTGLPAGWEGSLGLRQLRFGGPPVTLLTGSIGKYAGNYWASLRPFLRFKATGTSASLGITARRYFADADHYAGVRAGYGSTPSDQITPDQLARTSSYSADVHGSGGPWQRAVGIWSLGFGREELTGGRIRRSWTATAGLKVGF